MWTCPHCGEELDADFDVCWNCGTDRSGNRDPDFQPEDADPDVPDPGPEGEDTQLFETPGGAHGRITAAPSVRPGSLPVLSPDVDDDSLVAVASFLNPAQAWIAKNALTAEGIPATVVDEHVPDMYWLFSQAIGGVKVLVQARDFSRAASILAEDRSNVFPPSPKNTSGAICPTCGARELRRNRYSRRAAFIGWLLFGFPLPIPLTTVHCLECGYKDAEPITVPTQFTIRHLLILTFLVAVFLSFAKMLGADWFTALASAMRPLPR